VGAGAWSPLPGGGRLWRLAVTSPGAGSQSLLFRRAARQHCSAPPPTVPPPSPSCGAPPAAHATAAAQSHSVFISGLAGVWQRGLPRPCRAAQRGGQCEARQACSAGCLAPCARSDAYLPPGTALLARQDMPGLGLGQRLGQPATHADCLAPCARSDVYLPPGAALFVYRPGADRSAAACATAACQRYADLATRVLTTVPIDGARTLQRWRVSCALC